MLYGTFQSVAKCSAEIAVNRKQSWVLVLLFIARSLWLEVVWQTEEPGDLASSGEVTSLSERSRRGHYASALNPVGREHN